MKSLKASALRQRVLDLQDLTLRQLTADILVDHLEEYMDVVVHGARQLYLEQQRERPKEVRKWLLPGGKAGNSAFRTDIIKVQEAVRREVDSLASMRRISSHEAAHASLIGRVSVRSNPRPGLSLTIC